MRKRRPRFVNQKAPISLGGTEREEGLPLSLVHYPGHYGTFCAFAADVGKNPGLCACARSAVENLFLLEAEEIRDREQSRAEGPRLATRHFPSHVTADAVGASVVVDEWFSFGASLCHRCNFAVPAKRWCHQMYGGRFAQSFGWYINQVYFRLGIQPVVLRYLPEVCPVDFQEQIDAFREADDSYRRAYQAVMEPDARRPLKEMPPSDPVNDRHMPSQRAALMREKKKERDRLQRILKNEIENIVREEFGFRKIGKGWVSETLLYQLIKKIFEGEEVLHHHRPNWLDGLELDIFVPSYNLGIEYQGQQHFHPVEVWGGASALRSLQERDDMKRRLCAEVGVILVEIDYTEPLTESHVRQRLAEARE